jgi:hypothetical protein
MKQVITIHRDGSISGLQRKPGQGLDLRQLGKAEIRRATEILWNEEEQAWYIHILQGLHATDPLGPFHCGIADVSYEEVSALAPSGVRPAYGGGYLLFNEYDEAVKVEIVVLDALRVKGLL